MLDEKLLKKIEEANLTEEARAYLDIMNSQPSIANFEPAIVRASMSNAQKPTFTLPELESIQDKSIPMNDGESINVRIYTPIGSGPFPLVVYYHGGGWVLGDIEVSNESCHILAAKTPAIVVSVDYRLAPEYKYPTPVNDSYEALLWVHAHANELKGDASKIFVAGDSAGGNLSAVVAQKLKNENGPKLAGQMLMYPVTALDYNTNSYGKHAEGFGLDKDVMVWFGTHYIRNENDKKDPYVAPLYSNDLTNLPPAIVFTAENDVLADEGIAYAEKLEKSGVPVEKVEELGLVHGYFTNYAMFGERVEQSIERMVAFIKKYS